MPTFLRLKQGRTWLGQNTVDPGVDITPDAFSFDANVLDAELSSPYISSLETITGMDAATPISITNGEYRIDGGSWNVFVGTINPGQAVEVRVQSSSSPGTQVVGRLTIGTVSADFVVTTAADSNAPVFTAVPSRTNVTAASVEVGATSNESGSAKYLLTSALANQPADNAFDASALSSTVTANTPFNLSLTGIDASTFPGRLGRAWIQVTDADGNKSTAFVNVLFPHTGHVAFVEFSSVNTNASNRITSTPDIEVGNFGVVTNVQGIGSVTLNADGTFVADPGVTAFDVYIGDESADGWGNVATQTIAGSDPLAPVISLYGDNALILEVGNSFVEPGFSALDNSGGDLTADVVVTHNINSNVLGVYSAEYNVSDSEGNQALTVSRTVQVVDLIAPVITLNGGNIVLSVGETYFEPGFVAVDNYDGVITGNVIISGSVDRNTPGVYLLTYAVSDSSGNVAEPKQRSVIVSDAEKPVIDLIGGQVNLVVGQPYIEPGYSAFDSIDGNITSNVITSGTIDIHKIGEYVRSYDVADSSGLSADTVTRTIIVADATAPEINLLGAVVELSLAQAYIEPGYTATDNLDGDISSRVEVTGAVDIFTPGSYTLTYNVTDSSGNPAIPVQRTVTVGAAEPPVISLVGGAVNLLVGESFVEPGYSATDYLDGNITGNVVVVDDIDTSAPGTYVRTYSVVDGLGNAALQVQRLVHVTVALGRLRTTLHTDREGKVPYTDSGVKYWVISPDDSIALTGVFNPGLSGTFEVEDQSLTAGTTVRVVFEPADSSFLSATRLTVL